MTPTNQQDERIACGKGNLTNQQQRETITALNSFDKEIEKSMEDTNPKRCHVEKCAINLEKDCTCDSFHTFDELYDHRITLFIALARLLRRQESQLGISRAFPFVWRSKNHSNGELCFGTGTQYLLGVGSFQGQQISYHIPIERWREADFAETLECAPKWDGHTSDDVLERLKTL